MKNAIRYSSIFFAMAIVMFAAGVKDAAAQGPLTEILNRMDAHNKTLQSVQANVTMVKVNVQLGEPDTYLGSTKYLPNAKGRKYMRLDWSKPAVEQISVIGDDYELYKPSINQVYTGRVDRAKTSAGAGNALNFMNMNRAQLKANYTVVYMGQESVGGTQTWHLQLTPKTANSYKSAELWVDANGMPIQGKVVELNNDTTTVTLSDVQKNVVINPSIFKLSYPGNAKRIKA